MRSQPLITYLKPRDRKALDALAASRGMSLSMTLVDLVRDAFIAAFGSTADPAEVLVRHAPTFATRVVKTQRAKRKHQPTSIREG
jgi:hypothetical protein